MTARGSIRGVAWGGLAAWTVWLGMTALAAGFVARYAYPLPFGDELTLLPVVSGQRPVTLDWLWTPHNEHRICLPRLVYLGLGWATGYDFRRMAQFNVAMLAVLSAVLMIAVRTLRGRTTAGDAVFPLALLNAGHHANLVCAFQLCFVMSATLCTLALVPIALGRHLTPARAAAVLICVLGAGACGACGICFSLPVAGWFVLTAVSDRQQQGRWPWGLYGAAVILVGFVTLYFWNDTMESYHARPPGLWAGVRTALEFAAASLGPSGKEIWPLSVLIVACGLAIAAGQEVAVWLGRPDERSRAGGLLAFLVGMVILAGGIGWGRSSFGPGAGFSERYATLAVPMLVYFYLHTVLYVSPRWGVHVERLMASLLVAVALVGAHKGVRQEREIGGAVENLADDMRRGLSPAGLAVRHGDRLAFSSVEEFTDRLAILRQARLGPYREALPAERPIRVRRIAELADPSQPPQWKPVPPGATFAQSFAIEPGERLERIDLQWWSQGSRWTNSLAWTLAEVTRAGQRKMLASGRIEAERDVRGQYSTLVMPPCADGPRQLELVLAPAEQPSRRPAYLPVYRGRSDGIILRAFLFVSPVDE